MLSCNHMQMFFDLTKNYKKQTLKKYTIAFRDKLLSKIQNAIHMASSLSTDSNKKIFNDDFLTKKEYNFLYQVAIEKQDRNAIEIISDCISV